jgi:hypothetical protein
MESVGTDILFSISKSKVCEKVIYNLWKLPYSKAEFIFRSENIEDVKAQALQLNNEQSASINSKVTGSIGV